MTTSYPSLAVELSNSVADKSCSAVDALGRGKFAKLANQITIFSTMVGLIEGLIYEHKAGLDLGVYLDAIQQV